jgi:F-box and leucine-rich repeat protein GRR1
MSPGVHSVPFLYFTKLDYTSPSPYIGLTTTMKFSAMSPIPLAKRLSFRRGMKLLRPRHARNSSIPEDMKVVSRVPGPEELERVRHILFPTGDYTDIKDEEIAAVIPHCVNLEVVQLSGIEDTSDRTIAILAATATKLRGLDLGGCSRITDRGVLELAAKCTTLEWIRLSGVSGVTDSAISALARSCPRLSELELDACEGLTAVSIRDVWTFTRKLRRLKLTRCKQLTALAFPALVDENTSVPYWQPTAGDEKDSVAGSTTLLPPLILPPAYSPDNLRVLDLGFCTKITDDAMAGIISNATKIQTLTISGCARLTDKTMDSICMLGENLDVLTMAHVSKITDTGVVRLVRACTRLRSVDLNCESRPS